MAVCLIFLSLFLFPGYGKCFSTPSQDLDWKLGQTVGGVEFYYAITSCKGSSTVFHKINNKNAYPVQIAWKEVFDTQAEKSVEGYNGQKKLVVQPGETYETDCINPTHKALVTLASSAIPTYIATITKFNYKDVTVIRMN